MNNEVYDSKQAESGHTTSGVFTRKKMIVVIGGAVALCLVLVLLANWSLIRQISTLSPIILPDFSPAPATEAEARLQDIAYLSSLLDYDRSFGERARIQFEQLITDGRQEAETMSLAQLYLLAAKGAALADNGLTNVFRSVQREFDTVGVRYFYFEDGLYVVRALAEHEHLIGSRVLEIDGQLIDYVLTDLKSYVGGTEAWRQLFAVERLDSPEVLHAAGLVDSPAGYTLTVQDQQGDTRQVALAAQVPPIGENTPAIRPRDILEAGALPAEREAWVRSLMIESDDRRPLYLQQTDQAYWWATLPDGGGYIRLKTMYNSEQQTMAAFFDEKIKPLADGSLPYLVVDLRSNDGGDFTNFVEIARWLPDKVADDGRLYAVVGPQTFSAGLQGAALLKYYGGEKSSIIGSPMGDREQFWAERGPFSFRLPNSGISVGYATGYHDWAKGCEEHPYCYTQALIHGVKAGSLTPDPVIEPQYADYAAGKDVVMEWIHQQELP